jgi:nucleotide-binding universal stress UspA family protein
VVPLDGSALAEQILPAIAKLADVEGSELTLLYVLKPHAHSHEQAQSPMLAWWEKDVASARAYLLPVATELRRRGSTVSSDIVIGDNVAEKIGEFARCEKAELIAIATHGRGGLSRLIYGSVTDALMKFARTSVLVLRPPARGVSTDAKPFVEQRIAAIA